MARGIDPTRVTDPADVLTGSGEQFTAAWERLNGRDYPFSVWRVEFELVG